MTPQESNVPMFSLIFLFLLCTCRTIFCYHSHPLPDSTPGQPWLFQPYACKTEQQLCTSLGSPALASISGAFPFMSEFIRNDHPCWSPAAFSWISACQDGFFLNMEKLILGYQPALLYHSLLQSHILWDSSKQIFKEVEVCPPEIQVWVLVFVLLLHLGILNSTISWSLHLRLPLTFMSWTSSPLFVTIRSSKAPSPVGFLITSARKLLSMNLRNFLEHLNPAVSSF